EARQDAASYGDGHQYLPRTRSVLVDLVENAAFAKMILLRPGPAAEHIVDGEQLDLREGAFVLPGDLGIARAIGVARGDLLALLRIPVFEIGLGDLARALLVDHLVDDGERRLGEDRPWRRDDLEFLLAEFAQSEERLVLPGDQHIADAALDEGHG